MNYLGSKLREIRESKGLLLREVAAKIEIDTGLMSKLERGERRAQREHVLRIATALNINKDDLLVLWLADKVTEAIHDEPLGIKAIKLIEKENR